MWMRNELSSAVVVVVIREATQLHDALLKIMEDFTAML